MDSTTTKLRVGVIGLGSMGMGVALNLVQHGHSVFGAELREAARAELVAAGGQAVAKASELPGGMEALVVFVVNAAQVDSVLFGAEGCLDRLAPGGVVLCCTTVAPEYARSLDARLAERQLRLLDAPVSGGAGAARGGAGGGGDGQPPVGRLHTGDAAAAEGGPPAEPDAACRGVRQPAG